MSDLREDPFAAHRPLWDELDTVQQAVRAAIAADDMQTWGEHASRGAEIYEELARLSGWRDDSPPYDPVANICVGCPGCLTGGRCIEDPSDPDDDDREEDQ